MFVLIVVKYLTCKGAKEGGAESSCANYGHKDIRFLYGSQQNGGFFQYSDTNLFFLSGTISLLLLPN